MNKYTDGEEQDIQKDKGAEPICGYGGYVPFYTGRYRVLPGPEMYLSPSAAIMGVELPDPGEALVEGEIVPEEVAFEKAARKFLEAKVPTIHPGPLVLWRWNETAAHKSQALRVLCEAIPNCLVIPMIDYRPKYPKIDPDKEINPNHPNLTLWHNREDVCMFVGVHCHFANLSLKIIRAGTNTYTIAMCAQHGHEDAMISFRDASAEKILHLAEWVNRLRPEYGKEGVPGFVSRKRAHGSNVWEYGKSK